MAAKIVFERWNKDMTKLESHTVFDSVDDFLAYVTEFKKQANTAILRVHIPSSLPLAVADIAMLDKLEITYF